MYYKGGLNTFDIKGYGKIVTIKEARSYYQPSKAVVP
jgi:hypothetical protein